MIKPILVGGCAIGALSIAAAFATSATAQQAKPPRIEAVYWLSAETISGMSTGRPAGVEKNLMLQLGSIHGNPAPSAAHLPPQALRAGERLPLITPRTAVDKADPRSAYRPGQAQMPKGRMEIYWGCGEGTGSGQPLAIDFASIRAGGASPFPAGPQVTAMNPPSQDRHATYGERPSGSRGTRIAREGSLVGDHVVQGNYSPEMRFAVAASNDFLAPLAPRYTTLASGAVNVNWPALANAHGYILSIVASRGDGTMVMWTSSAIRMAGMQLPDYLTQADIARLVQQRVLLAPDATQCAVPAAVARASESPMLIMTAYGPEGNYGSPREAPAGWSVKLRTKATHMGVLGADLSAGGEVDEDEPDGDDATEAAKPRKKRGLLRGVIGGALGIPG